MTKEEIISLQQVAQTAAQRLVEVAQSQKEAVEIARAAAEKLRGDSEKVLIEAQNALALLGEATDRESAETAVTEAKRALKAAGKQADGDVAAAVFGAEKLVAVATSAVTEAEQAVAAARSTLIDEQKINAVCLVRYMRRYAPGDAATAKQILATYEPEAVAHGEQTAAAETAEIEARLTDGAADAKLASYYPSGTPVAVTPSPRLRRRGP